MENLKQLMLNEEYVVITPAGEHISIKIALREKHCSKLLSTYVETNDGLCDSSDIYGADINNVKSITVVISS